MPLDTLPALTAEFAGFPWWAWLICIVIALALGVLILPSDFSD